MPIKTYKNFDLKKLLTKLKVGPEIPGLLILMVPDEEARFYGIIANDDDEFIVTRQFEGLERDGSFCCESDDAMFCSLEETISKLGGRKLYQGIEASSLSEGERLMKKYESNFGVPAVQKMLEKLSITERHEIFQSLWNNYENVTCLPPQQECEVRPWCCVGCEKLKIEGEDESDFSLCGFCEKYSCPKCIKISECCEEGKKEKNEKKKRKEKNKVLVYFRPYYLWDLKKMCKDRGLDSDGSRKVLISRIVEHKKENGEKLSFSSP